jgi:hypothetical protein
MANSNGSATCRDSGQPALRVDRSAPMQAPSDFRSDRLCSEDIDSQIRWFFDNALDRESPHHR